jgi:hypothetical protein
MLNYMAANPLIATARPSSGILPNVTTTVVAFALLDGYQTKLTLEKQPIKIVVKKAGSMVELSLLTSGDVIFQRMDIHFIIWRQMLENYLQNVGYPFRGTDKICNHFIDTKVLDNGELQMAFTQESPTYAGSIFFITLPAERVVQLCANFVTD